ncbi:DUF1080 domain-containing protein [Flammeovirgaceae bacterium SG7u.111]|nr:DUF1080 domain-containing protein [Flammeovirgaceae bacterium SG7u.132]WPO38611.1 DUF1080 domain-containing protein [Flammeovirgaceae bacterium SG7u.111]
MKTVMTLLFCLGTAIILPAQAQNSFEISKKWQPLLDKELSNFELFVGVPHETVEIKGYETSANVTKGKPIGLNDPLNIMTTIEEDGELVLKITGEVYAGLTTLQEFGDYHLKAEFKWGEKKWEPRLNQKRDNGILYHCHGEHGTFWKVWMSSLEFQVQETDMGDFVGLVHARADIRSSKVKDGFYQVTDDSKEYITYGGGGGNPGYCHINKHNEKPNGEWNTVELICVGRKSIHVVNGKVVMVVENARKVINGEEIPLSKGKLQFQSEAAEAYYKNIEIKSVKKFPKEYQKQLVD